MFGVPPTSQSSSLITSQRASEDTLPCAADLSLPHFAPVLILVRESQTPLAKRSSSCPHYSHLKMGHLTTLHQAHRQKSPLWYVA